MTFDQQRFKLWDRIYDINEQSFDTVALDVFYFQATYNPVYKQYLELLGIDASSIVRTADIPFLPIQLFKDHEIKSGVWTPQFVFESSGTTGQVPSRHYVRDIEHYHSVSLLSFPSDLGYPGDYCWIGLLPSYLERESSSLVNMVKYFMEKGQCRESFFTLKIDQDLVRKLHACAAIRKPVILIGVTFALLDLFEMFSVPVWPELLIIETGGMKGREKEITRMEVYERMRKNNPQLSIRSEYGMTELFSQAYSTDSIFSTAPTMKVYVREINDPFQLLPLNRRGGLNIIDLGNLDTCSFLATEDAGVQLSDNSFQVLGRLDASEIRGCNLMYTG